MSHHLEDLLPRIERRDEEAFRILYEETKKGVYAMIAAIVTDRQTIEDLMQDTYMKMLAKLDTYERGRNFTAWLFQIAKNLAFDHVRKNAKTTIVDPIEDAVVFDRPAEPEHRADDPSLAEMLSCLEGEEAEIVWLRAVAQTPFKDIATTMNKPLGTVLWLYQRALKKIKIHLEGRE
jgi:RNA polymerase sigma-70 factor (ECF subfamily)